MNQLDSEHDSNGMQRIRSVRNTILRFMLVLVTVFGLFWSGVIPLDYALATTLTISLMVLAEIGLGVPSALYRRFR